jgi:peptidoglycan/LPS O-acetylase OafA/YrhL
VVLAATTLAAALVLGPQEIDSTARAALASSLYVSNIFFDHASSDYFAAAVQRNPLLHTWSLGVEEQFYLVWPGLILFASRSRRARPVVWILGALAAGSFACGVLATRAAPMFAFYELPARAWEFAAGGLLALPTAVASSARTRIWAVTGGIVGAAMILGTVLWVKGGSGFPGWIALVPVAGTLLTLFAGVVAPQRGVSAVLGAAPLQFLGARSYSWYLWHWPFVVFAEVLLPAITVMQKIEAAVAALLMAAMTYRWIEQPIRTSRYLARRSNLSLSAAAGAALLTVGAAAALVSFAHRQMTLDAKYAAIQAATMDYGFAERCYADGESAEAVEAKICEFGDPRAARTLALFGDSHAMQWISAMRKAADAEGWRLLTLVKPGCAASDISPHNLSVPSDACQVWRERAIQKIIDLTPFAVVMASYNGAIVRNEDMLTSNLMPVEEVRSGTRSTLLKLGAAGIRVVVLRDSPLPPFNVPACISRSIGRAHSTVDPCGFDASKALNASAFEAERAAGEGLTNVYYLDLDDLICPGASCPAVRDGRIVYRDENHLAGSYAESLAGEVATRLSLILDRAPALAHRSGD